MAAPFSVAKTKEEFLHEGLNLLSLMKQQDYIGKSPDFDCTDNLHKVYLVSSFWLEAFKKKTAADKREQGQFPTVDDVTDEELPRLNEDLLDTEADLSKYLKYNADHPQFEYLYPACKIPLIENENFIYVTEQIWEFIKTRYPDAIAIQRQAYADKGRVRFEVNLTKVQIYFASNEKLKTWSEETERPRPLNLNISFRMTIGDLKTLLMYQAREYLDPSLFSMTFTEKKVKIYVLGEYCTISNFKSEVKKSFNRSKTKDIAIDADNLMDDQDLVQKFRQNISQDSEMVILIKSYSDFRLRGKNESLSLTSGTNSSPIKHMAASSGSGGQISYMNSYSAVPVFPEPSSESKCGAVGLYNIGNTCYMNSALQCLSHTKVFVDYFLQKKFSDDKNLDNVLGSKGKLVESFAELMFQMHNGNMGVVKPQKFKYEMGSFHNQFEGMGQQDSQEFLSRLIDGLHEDLNLIKKKPYVEKLEAKPDDSHEVVGRQSWIGNLKRDYSEIMNIFYGQFKNESSCPQCPRRVITFEPFQLVSLAVPKKTSVCLTPYFITKNHNSQAKKVKLNINFMVDKEPNVAEVLAQFHESQTMSGEEFDSKSYFFAFVGFETVGKILRSNSSITFIEKQSKDRQFLPQLFLFQMDENERALYHSDKLITVIGQSVLESSLGNPSKIAQDKLAFNKFILSHREMTVSELYFNAFKKFAHFHDYDENGITSKCEKEYDGVQNPLPHVDYEEIYQKYFLSGKEGHQFFKIVLDDEELQVQSKQTVGELIDGSDEFNPNTSTLKVLLVFHPDHQTYAKIQYAKKAGTEDQVINYDKSGNDASTKIQDLITAFSSPEQLDEDNLWYCSDCKEHVRATKTIQIFKSPRILILHMKKLKNGATSIMGMIMQGARQQQAHHFVDFPLDGLDMTPYVISGQLIDSYNIEKAEFMDEGNEKLEKRELTKYLTQPGSQLIYDCFGVVNHYGSQMFGHYTAFVRREDGWYKGDDSNFSKVDPSVVVSEAAYLLFYKLRD